MATSLIDKPWVLHLDQLHPHLYTSTLQPPTLRVNLIRPDHHLKYFAVFRVSSPIALKDMSAIRRVDRLKTPSPLLKLPTCLVVASILDSST
jgi:hypothetical protein